MKAKKQQKGNGNEEILQKLVIVFKKKCDSFGTIQNSALKNWLEQGAESLKLELIKMHQPLGPTQTRALMQALTDVKFSKLKAICIWKSKIQDQGVRNICKYLESVPNNSVEVLDLLQNQITSLGCQFLGKTFTYPLVNVKHLKLDNNLIGDKGIQNLSVGLKRNTVLTKLSLKYCGITHKGIKYIQQILANISSKIRSIKLQGNSLGNQGILDFLKVVELNEMLQKINIADTGLNLLDFAAEKVQWLQTEKDEDTFREQDQNNPEKQEISALQLIKQTNIPPSIKQKFGGNSLLVYKPQNEKSDIKYTKRVNQNDKSLSANILRLLIEIMQNNLLIRKYDLRFNPLSNDAAEMLFEVIERNSQIKDVEINNNVDNQLRENLDTLMRKRTGRLPKRRGGGKTKGKKK